jgi:hypothetical protein
MSLKQPDNRPSVAFSILLSVIISEVVEVVMKALGGGLDLSLDPDWLIFTVLGDKTAYIS